MWQALLKVLITEIVGAITKMVSDYVKLKQLKKENKEKVDNALKEKDPKRRAKNIRLLLRK